MVTDKKIGDKAADLKRGFRVYDTVRGKANKSVEFGAKLNVTLPGNGLANISAISD